MLNCFYELVLLSFRGFLPEIDGHIIFCHVLKLISRNVGNRIPQAEACQQQCCTAADADEHHGKSLLVAENVADGDLIQEADPLPEWQLFHKDLFARLWRLGPDQLRGILRQCLVAAPPGHKEHNRRVGHQHRQRKRPIYGQHHIGLDTQHDAVGLP